VPQHFSVRIEELAVDQEEMHISFKVVDCVMIVKNDVVLPLMKKTTLLEVGERTVHRFDVRPCSVLIEE
jgi:hypothetical protein